MSKGSARRPGVNYETNYERMFKPWFCTDCGSKAVAGGPDGSWKVCPNPACETGSDPGSGVFHRPYPPDLMEARKESLKPVPQADGSPPYPWCRLRTCRGSCPHNPSCGD